MSNTSSYSIAVFAGDGIGQEITDPCLELLKQAVAKAQAPALSFQPVPAGAAAYRDLGQALPDESMRVARAADAILLAAMGDPSIRYPDGTEIAPQLDLRFDMNLYAGIRPIRAIPGVVLPLASPRAKDIDFVLIRESTEGLFASHGKGTVENDAIASETLKITRDTCEKLFHTAFKLAEQRKPSRMNGHVSRVTCVDKANVFSAFAFFRKIFNEVGDRYSTPYDHAYVDAMAMWLITKPWDYDVLVTENMFGDILSDQAAALIGGMGYAPSADIGDDHAVFQPCHGSAPDIAGKGILGEKFDDARMRNAGQLLQNAVDEAFAPGNLVTTELGGDAGVDAVTNAVSKALMQ